MSQTRGGPGWNDGLGAWETPGLVQSVFPPIVYGAGELSWSLISNGT